MTPVSATIAVSNIPVADAPAALIVRVNQLYHELTQSGFDREHEYRHRVEAPFWRWVGQTVLSPPAVISRASIATAARAQRGPRVVLDLACGTGFVSNLLKPFLRRDDRMIAADLSIPALRITRAKWQRTGNRAPALTCLRAGGDTLPLPDASVDLVAINASLHHFAEPLVALRELDRVLKPGGYFALGFEPNSRHFNSTVLPRISRSLDRLGWYLSPEQNYRRFRKYLHIGRHARRSRQNADSGEFVTHAINRRLMLEGLIAQPLSRDAILDLVDPHARGADGHSGFDPQLLSKVLAGYEVLLLSTSDYFGETARRFPRVRGLLDRGLRMALPQHGSLFCWLMRKGGGKA